MAKPWLSFYEKGVSETLTYPDITLDTMFAQTVQQYPDKTATNFVLKYLLGKRLTIGGKLTYRQLDDLVGRFANALAQLGVSKGDRIAIMLPNSPHYIIAFFAAMRIGAIAVNTNPTYTGRELRHQLEDSGADTILLLNIFMPKLQEAQQHVTLKRVIVANVFDTLKFPSSLLVKQSQRKTPEWVDVQPSDTVFMFADLLKQYEPTPPRPEVSPDDVALFQYTGGTTGLPKAAMLTHRNLISNMLQIANWLTDGARGKERMMGAIPFFHVYGTTVCMVYGIYMASDMVIIPNPREIDHVLDVLQKERTSIFPGVPAMYIRIINHPEVTSYDLGSIRVCISGSAPLPMEVQEQFGSITGGRLIEGYGMTEASPVTHCNTVYGTRKAGSIGIPLPDVEAKIISLENSEELAFGGDETGELCVRGPQVMKGYWNYEDETSETIDADGWLHTGDICKVDDDGFFYIVDRKKDIIISGGFNVLPRDVEEVLYMHPDVMEAVVAGIPNAARGDEAVTAFIVAKEGTNPTADGVKEFCKQHLAPYKVPRVVQFRDELPKTAVGKVLRRVLVEEEKAKQHDKSAVPAG